MKQALSLLCLLFIAGYSISQNITIRFRSEFIHLPITEEYSKKDYTLKTVLNKEGEILLKEALASNEMAGLLNGNTPIEKIFGNLSWKDSLSVNRFGDIISVPPFWATFSMKAPDYATALKVIRFFNKHNELIAYAELAPTVEPLSYPNDEFYNQQYSLVYNPSIPEASINIEGAWDMETGKPFVKVGVLDNGIDSIHPDIDLLFGGTYHNQDDVDGIMISHWGETTGLEHGTPVAGIIGAKRNNETGIAGVAGGDGTDSSGISLIDLKTIYNAFVPTQYFMAATVDGARSVGSYWQYPLNDYVNQYAEDYPYFQQAPGFGLHVQNNSYMIKAEIPTHIEGGKDLADPQIDDIGECQLCRETFLFSYKSGVINVVARGNSGNVAPDPVSGEVDLTTVFGYFPQSFPDNWIISVGASGYDGTTVREGINQGYYDELVNFESLYGGNMDLIAPGSDSIVFTLQYVDSTPGYRTGNGTSVAAPHVSGVVGLLLSYYDRDCYVNQNLTIEDVEYILEHSATDVLDPGYDQISAHGRLNAHEALKMIEYPIKQFVHPTNIVQTDLLDRDTIALHYRKAITDDAWGPISRNFAPRNETYYQVERLHYQTTYDFSEYITPTTEINAVFPLQSRSTALRFHEDTIDIALPGWGYDNFDVNPYNHIVNIDTTNALVTTEGYYYHFINTYFEQNNFEIDSAHPIDYWYPINPLTDQPKLPVSIYLTDSSLMQIYGSDLPCDSLNLPYDTQLAINVLEDEALLLYPNPSKGLLEINLPETGKNHLQVYNLIGEMVYEQAVNEKKTTLNLTFLPAGTFIVKVSNGDGLLHAKWIKL
ncbi:MAG TPA: S8 family serine peptidase [Fluviicola sp.]|nr:S8 family serine peptidase [Fluviicola sp.]